MHLCLNMYNVQEPSVNWAAGRLLSRATLIFQVLLLHKQHFILRLGFFLLGDSSAVYVGDMNMFGLLTFHLRTTTSCFLARRNAIRDLRRTRC